MVKNAGGNNKIGSTNLSRYISCGLESQRVRPIRKRLLGTVTERYTYFFTRAVKHFSTTRWVQYNSGCGARNVIKASSKDTGQQAVTQK